VENPELTTTITRKNAIRRYIQGIADQHLPVRIARSEEEAELRSYKTQIARIDKDGSQIVIHQPKPSDWQRHLQDTESLYVSCRMPNGTIQFNGNLSLLEGAENSPYCQLTFPAELNKKQLRSNFRVSVLKYGSKIELELPNAEKKLKGICNDISLGGVLVHLPYCNEPLKKGDEINNLQLRIPGILELKCVAKVCRITEIEGTGIFMGLSFESLLPRQAKDLRLALIKLERRNIKTDPIAL